MCDKSENIRVLLVEDSEDDAFFFELALQRSGWPCEQTHVIDGSQAMDFLERTSKEGVLPHVVFLDLKLPIFTGFEVLQWISAQNFEPHLPVVVLSGSDHHADIRLARELGATDYLVKPVSAEDLRKRLAALPRSTSWNAERTNPPLKAALP